METKFSEEKLKESARKTSIQEGAAASVADGFGIRNIIPYAVAMGASNQIIGLLSSVPSLLGNLSQLFTHNLMRKHSRKNIISVSVFSQALMWLFLIIPGFMYFILEKDSEISGTLLLIIYTFLIIAGSIGGPAWTSWMKDIIPLKNGEYFGKRNKITGSISLIAMLLAGFLLDYFKNTKIFFGFFILFFLSFIFRGFSGYLLLRKKYEPEFRQSKDHYFSLLQFLKKMPHTNFGRFTIFISLISFTVALSAPFFAVYMLKDLNFSYVTFTLISLSASLTTIFFMPIWGKLSDSYGTVKIMKVCGFFISFIPIFWIFSYFLETSLLSIGYLFIVESFSGFLWAGFNLANGNFIYNTVSKEKLAIVISYFGLINGFSVFLGANIGGVISSMNFSLFSLSPILFLFLLSSIIRFLFFILFVNKINEVKEVEKFSSKEFGLKLTKLSLNGLFGYFNVRFFKPKIVE
jgi:MFS family permease